MADALLEISRVGSKYFHPPAEQLGLDMLKRLGDHHLLVNELLGRQMILEALVMIQKYNVANLDIKKLFTAAESTQDEEVIALVSEFVKGQQFK